MMQIYIDGGILNEGSLSNMVAAKYIVCNHNGQIWNEKEWHKTKRSDTENI